MTLKDMKMLETFLNTHDGTVVASVRRCVDSDEFELRFLSPYKEGMKQIEVFILKVGQTYDQTSN